MRLTRKEWIVFLLLFDDYPHHLYDDDDDFDYEDDDDDDDDDDEDHLSDPILVYLFFRWLRQNRAKEKTFILSRNRKAFYKSLSAEEKRKRDRRISRSSLQPPRESSWRTLYNSGVHQDLITFTGFDHPTFDLLQSKFVPLYNSYTPFGTSDGSIKKLKSTHGRKRLIDGKDCLALYLAWTRLRGSTAPLQMLFGMTGTPIGMYIKFARRILIKVLSAEKDAAIAIPDDTKIKMYQDVIEKNIQL